MSMQHHRISATENWMKLALVNSVHVLIGLNGKNGVIAQQHVTVVNVEGPVVACLVLDVLGAKQTHLISRLVTRTVVLTGTNGPNGNLVPKHVALENESERVAVMDLIAWALVMKLVNAMMVHVLSGLNGQNILNVRSRVV